MCCNLDCIGKEGIGFGCAATVFGSKSSQVSRSNGSYKGSALLLLWPLIGANECEWSHRAVPILIPCDSRYSTCISLDKENFLAHERLLQLRPFSIEKSSLEDLTTNPVSQQVSQYEKHTLFCELCQLHPYLFPPSRFRVIEDDIRNIPALLSICRCLRERGELAASDLLLQRILKMEVFSHDVLIECSILFYQKNETNRLFLFIHSLPPSLIDSVEYCYLLGVYALLRKDHYQALQHFNLALTRKPLFWEAWVGIGLVRSALVIVHRTSHV